MLDSFWWGPGAHTTYTPAPPKESLPPDH